MGTRCLTNFREDETIICSMYRQMDGYPAGHGKELIEFLSGYKIVNGINSRGEKTYSKLANGLGCLAAQTIAHFKRNSRVGGFYMQASGDNGGVCYVYTVYLLRGPGSWGTVYLKVETREQVLFDGKLEDCSLDAINQRQEELDDASN